MIWFWIILAVILVVVGLFIWTQGAGPGVACVGGVIALILIIVQSIT